MNRIAIDVGNSFAKWGVFVGGDLRGTERIPSSDFARVDDWATASREVCEAYKIATGSVRAVTAVSVLPSGLTALDDWLASLSVTTHRVGPQTPVPIEHRYDDLSRLGMDRWVNAIAGWAWLQEHASGDGVLVVDAGTAMTFDLVSASGCYLGGAIAPGPMAAQRGLTESAPRLPNVLPLAPQAEPSPRRPPGSHNANYRPNDDLIGLPLIGTNPRDCVRSGLIHGARSIVAGMIDAFKDTQATRTRVLVTGGWGMTLAQGLAEVDAIDPELTMRGLLSISLSLDSSD